MLRGMAGLEATVTLVVGEEELLVERAVKAVLAAVAERDPDVHDVRGGELSSGELSMLVAPSLFGGQNLVIVRGAHEAAAAVATEIGELAAAMPPDTTLVVTHSGGAKNKALLSGR